LKSCSHKARLVTFEIRNKNTTITNTHAHKHFTAHSTIVAYNIAVFVFFNFS